MLRYVRPQQSGYEGLRHKTVSCSSFSYTDKHKTIVSGYTVLMIQGRVLGARCKTLISQLNSRGAVEVFLKMYWIYAY